jgi:hypothetical protein
MKPKPYSMKNPRTARTRSALKWRRDPEHLPADTKGLPSFLATDHMAKQKA